MEYIIKTEDGKIVKAKYRAFINTLDSHRLTIDIYLKKTIFWIIPIWSKADLKSKYEMNYRFTDSINWNMRDYERRANELVKDMFRLSGEERGLLDFQQKCKDFEAIKDIPKEDVAVLELLTDE